MTERLKKRLDKIPEVKPIRGEAKDNPFRFGEH